MDVSDSLSTRAHRAVNPMCAVCGRRALMWRMMSPHLGAPFCVVCASCQLFYNRSNKENEKVNT